MIGAIIGDIVGSVYEFDHDFKSKDFELFGPKCNFTDDTVMTVAVADWLVSEQDRDLADVLRSWYHRYPDRCYGARFLRWCESPAMGPYFSYGNGSAMRVSAAAWLANSVQEAIDIAERSAMVTHNHANGILGAKAVAHAIFLAINGISQDDIRFEIATKYYNLDQHVGEIREWYMFDETCEGTVPQAITCALEATDFEDAIRNAVSIGGDSDTIAAIAGSIAEAGYGIPEEIANKALGYLSDDMLEVIDRFTVVAPSLALERISSVLGVPSPSPDQ